MSIKAENWSENHYISEIFKQNYRILTVDEHSGVRHPAGVVKFTGNLQEN